MDFPDFQNKTLSIFIDADSFNHDLTNPHFENQGGRIFIVGEIPKEATESGWNAKKIGAVAWDRVVEYVVFDSYEDYKKATEISESHSEKEDKEETT